MFFSLFQKDAQMILQEFITTNGQVFDDSETDTWEIQPAMEACSRLTWCGTKMLFGGYYKFGANAYLQRTITGLSAHYLARLRFQFMKIDSWENEDFIISIDGVALRTTSLNENSPSTMQPDLCGMFSKGETDMTFKETFSHSLSSLTVKFSTSLNEYAGNESWGISNLELLIYKCNAGCPQGCYGPSSNECICPSCNNPICGDYYYLKAGTLPCECSTCERCDITCKTCSGPLNNDCLSCEAEDTFSPPEKTCSYPASEFFY